MLGARKKAGDHPALMQSLWQGLAATAAGPTPAKAVSGVVIRA
jgi:hypothetical protein